MALAFYLAFSLCIILALLLLIYALKQANTRAGVQANRYAELKAKVDAREEMDKQILNALMRIGGGVRKRVYENIEITEAINKFAPHVFESELGLVHWLEAHQEFLEALDLAMVHTHDEWSNKRMQEFKQSGAREIFINIRNWSKTTAVD